MNSINIKSAYYIITIVINIIFIIIINIIVATIPPILQLIASILIVRTISLSFTYFMLPF